MGDRGRVREKKKRWWIALIFLEWFHSFLCLLLSALTYATNESSTYPPPFPVFTLPLIWSDFSTHAFDGGAWSPTFSPPFQSRTHPHISSRAAAHFFTWFRHGNMRTFQKDSCTHFTSHFCSPTCLVYNLYMVYKRDSVCLIELNVAIFDCKH